MFDDKIFEKRLGNQIRQITNKAVISQKAMRALALKAQTNLFAHLDIELCEKKQRLYEDIENRFNLIREEIKLNLNINKRFEKVLKL